MKKTRFWLSAAAALTGGACLVFGQTALATFPGAEPPASVWMDEQYDQASPTPAPAQVTPDHFDNGPCWEDETVAGDHCPWMDTTEEAWSYRYNAYQDKYADQVQDTAENNTDDTYGYRCDYDGCSWGDEDADAQVADMDPSPCYKDYDNYWEDDYCDYGEEPFCNDETPAEETYASQNDTNDYDYEYSWEGDTYGDEEYRDEEMTTEESYAADVYDDYEYDYGHEGYWGDEADQASDDEENSWDGDAYDYEEDYSGNDMTAGESYASDGEYEYGDEGYWGDEADQASTDEAAYGDGNYDDYDYEDWCPDEEMTAEETYATDDADMVYGFEDEYDAREYMDETYASDFDDEVYDEYDEGMDDQSGSWEDDYGYEYDSYAEQETEPEADSAENAWSYDYYDEGTYGYDDQRYDGYEDGYDEEWAEEETADDYGQYEYAQPQERYGSAELATEPNDDSMYEGYSDAYPYEEYAYPQDETDAVSDATEWEVSGEERSGCEVLYGDITDEEDPYDASADEEETSYEEMYEYDSYDGIEESVDEPAETAPATSADLGFSGCLELSGSQPAALLAFADQELLRTLQQTGGEASRLRRAGFAEHLEGLGWQAIDFAFRFEDASGREVLGLTDDVSATAAFLAAFRLVERGDLGMDEGVEALRRTLDDVTLDWIEGVDQITAEAYQTRDDQQLAGPACEPSHSFDPTRLNNPVIEAVVSVATKTLGDLSVTILDLQAKLVRLGWAPALAEPSQESPISQASAPEAPLQR